MNRFNSFIEKRNFKKIFIVFVIAAVLCGIACAVGVGYVFRDKISLALQYEKASEDFKRNSQNYSQTLDKLAAASPDIRDVLLLDEKNYIIYSAKNSEFASGGIFELKKANGGKFLQSAVSPDAVFRFVKKDEFMLSSAFADDFGEIYDEYDEDNFYLDNFQNKKLYLISMPGKNSSGTNVYVISSPTPVKYGVLSLKLAASAVMFLFMVYWIIIALWVYQNARKSKLSAPVWGIITLFTNLAGVLVYAVFKHINAICPFCGTVQPSGNIFCTSCGKKIGTVCSKCGHSLKRSDIFCPKCGHKK